MIKEHIRIHDLSDGKPIRVGLYLDGRRTFLQLNENIRTCYRTPSGTRTIEIPRGFESDGASVPRLFWGLISPAVHAGTIRAALCHDWLYGGHANDWTRREADALFRDFCREDGLAFWRAWLAWLALRLCGRTRWRPWTLQ